jgi:hypothetical protein
VFTDFFDDRKQHEKPGDDSTCCADGDGNRLEQTKREQTCAVQRCDDRRPRDEQCWIDFGQLSVESKTGLERDPSRV